ncbi:hypothetical protein Patl1_35035 [Pistacia atlantica]|uniref:Uncharacterized protein n=1 Tax=Pistacia atlantica TaxID=434234 RepID=A0ACC0ZSY8_9ROSI|nr:hypothetical protein Patl1_35035 [Pistacia atlantica]
MASSSTEKLPHVLAVDDSSVDRNIIQQLLLTNSACRVTTAENGEKALEFLGLAHGQDSCTCNSLIDLLALQDLEVNLVITDYSMPGMTGYELLKKMKESPTMKYIPVVILSSENNPRRIEQCKKEGANGFYKKPLTLTDIDQLVSSVKGLSYPSKKKHIIARE